MQTISRTLTRYFYTFGIIKRLDGNSADVEVTGIHSAFHQLGARELKHLADELGGQLVNVTQQKVKASCSLESFLDICDITEL